MEEWERELRERLNIEVSDGAYQIGVEKWIVWTGKQGYIDYLVALHRLVKDNRANLEKQVEEGRTDYHILDSNKLKEYIESLTNKDE